MSDLPRILRRLVKEGLRGPIHRTEPSPNLNPATVDKYKNLQPVATEQDPDWNDPRWKLLFNEFFVSDHLDDWHDDLLFFVQRGEVENGGKGADPVFVKRKVQGHKRILTPEQEQVVLWKDTFFLNVIVQLHCKLTVAVCTRVAETHPLTGVTRTSMTCTRKHVSKRVYASPTKSRMDVKEESVECSWPIIYYVIDDFEDMFEHLMVHGQEYLCVELGVSLPSDTPALNQTNGSIGSIARSGRSPYNDHHDGPQAGKPFPTGSTRGFGQDISGGIGSGGPGAGGVHGKITLFQGAASFQSLVGIYQQKASAKVAKRFKLGPRKVPQEFVMMRGPGGRGHAQVAITASDRLDDLSAAATGGGPGGLTSASETHLSRYHQSSAASLSSSPPLSNSALFMRAGQQQQQHQQKAHGDEKKVHPYPSDHQSLPRTSLDSQGRHRWSNGHHYQQPTPQATTVRQHSHRQYPPVAPSSSFFASPSQPTPPSSGNGDVSTIKAPPSKLSPTRSFSTGSFFNSLRKLSLATLAHATGSNQNHYRSPSPPPSPPPAPLPPHSLDTASSSSASASSSPYQSPSPSNGPGSRPRLHSFPQGPRGAMDEYEDEDTDTQSGSIRSGISAHGTGSRQEIEALVRDPKSLKCCMTFVNVPWTAIATTLMDFAYQQYLPSVTTATRKLKTTMVATNMPGNGATVHPK